MLITQHTIFSEDSESAGMVQKCVHTHHTANHLQLKYPHQVAHKAAPTHLSS